MQPTNTNNTVTLDFEVFGCTLQGEIELPVNGSTESIVQGMVREWLGSVSSKNSPPPSRMSSPSSSVPASPQPEDTFVPPAKRRCLDAELGTYAREATKETTQTLRTGPWVTDEHRQFLLGVQECGKGNWSMIAKHYVPTRNRMQVASHAQKYFNKFNKTNKGANTAKDAVIGDIQTPPSTELTLC